MITNTKIIRSYKMQIVMALHVFYDIRGTTVDVF